MTDVHRSSHDHYNRVLGIDDSEKDMRMERIERANSAKGSANVGPLLLGAAAVLFQSAFFGRELLERPADLNDDVLHVMIVDHVVAAIARGDDPTDPWISTIVQGFPLLHHYQHLPHVLTAYVCALTGLSSVAVWYFGQWLMFSGFPLVLAWTVRAFGGSAWQAAFAAVGAVLLATRGSFGLDVGSFGWSGSGLTTQLWGMVLLGPAWVFAMRAVRGEGRIVLAGAVLGAVLLCHTVMGYVGALGAGLFIILPDVRDVPRRLLRLVGVGIAAFATTAYFLIPFWLDRHAMNRSVWEDASKYDSYGAAQVLRSLARGDLLDGSAHFRLPILTILFAMGCLVALWRWRHDVCARIVLTFSAVWLVLYFGRPTLGVWLKLLPMSSELHFHRLVAPFQLAALGVVGLGGAFLVGAIPRAWRWRGAKAVTAALVAVLLAQPVWDRVHVYGERRGWQQGTTTALQREGTQFDAITVHLRALPSGRVYAGRAPNWGKGYAFGSVPVYALLTQRGIDNLGYLYHALSLNADVEGYLDERRAALFNLFNVRYLLAPSEVKAPEFAEPEQTSGRHRLYRVATSGWFDLVDVIGTYAGPRAGWFEAARAWLQSPAVDAKRHAIFYIDRPAPGYARPLDSLSGVLATPADVSRCGDLRSEHMEAGRASVIVAASRPCWVMLKATYHPRWQATIDGKAIEPVMLAPAFVGVPITAGEHRVELIYASPAWRPWLAVGGALLILLAFALERRRA